MSASVEDRRPAELVAALAAVRTRLADAAIAAQREPWSVTLLAVTKTFPVSDIAILGSLGVADIAESRDQEARAKLAQLAAIEHRPDSAIADVRLHFVGRLQTNKCRSVARYAASVHTVDRAAVASALAEGVRAAQRDALPVFLQVSLDGDTARGGVPVDGLAQLADEVAALDALQLRGVMAVAPLTEPPAQAYARLAEISAMLRADHRGASDISAGMSGDFETAVHFGATHVRIGSALLGHRGVTFG